MSMQQKLRNLKMEYRKLKSDSMKFMLKGDLQTYFKKLLQITMIENEYRELISRKQLRAA